MTLRPAFIAIFVASLVFAGSNAMAQEALQQLENMGGPLPPPPPTPPSSPVYEPAPEEPSPAPSYQPPPVNYYHPPVIYRPPVYYAPQPVGPSPAQIRAQQILNQAHNANQAGVAASYRGQWVAAMNDYRRALALSPNDPVIRENLRKAEDAVAVQTNNAGVAAWKRGDMAAAVADYRRALALNPANQTVKGNLQYALSVMKERQRLADARPAIVAALDAPSADPTNASPASSGGLDFMDGPNANPPAQTPPAPAADPLAAGVVVPSPVLASMKWSASFPSPDTAAATQMTQHDLDSLAAVGGKSREWLGEQLVSAAKDKAKDAGIDKAIESLPLADALKDETQWQEGLIERYKDLYQDVSNDTQNYLLGFAHVTSAAAGCLGSASTNCGGEAADVQVVANRYADQSENRWKSWVNTDIKSHLSRFFDGSNP